MSDTLFAEILKAKQGVRELTRREKSAAGDSGIKDKVWWQYGSSPDDKDKVYDYDISFEEALEALKIRSLRDYLTQRKERGLTTNVLDLMGGDPSFLRDLQRTHAGNNQGVESVINNGLSVALADDRTMALKDTDKKAGIDVLCGDLMSKHIWREIDLWQMNKGIKYFDLIVCRGVDGIWEIPPILYPYIFGKVWERLNDDGGLFVTQFSKSVSEREMWNIDSKLSREYPGMKHYVSENRIHGRFPTLGIIKTKSL